MRAQCKQKGQIYFERENSENENIKAPQKIQWTEKITWTFHKMNFRNANYANLFDGADHDSAHK